MDPTVTSFVFACRLLPAVLLALLALVVRKNHRRTLLPLAFLGLAVSLTAYLFSYATLDAGDPRIVYGSLLLIIPLPYFANLVATICFDDSFRFSWRQGAMLGGILVSQLISFKIFSRYLFARQNVGDFALFDLSVAVPFVTTIALTINIVRVATRDWQADLVEPRRRLRAVVLVATGVLVLASSSAEVVNVLSGLLDRRWSTAATAIAAVAAIAALYMALLDVSPSFFALPERPSEPETRQGDGQASSSGVPEAIEKLMRDGAYLDEQMTIARLAEKSGIPEYKVRRAINTVMGYRNFNQFLNHYRIKAAGERLASPKEASTKILAIAMDVGFNSLAPFNKAFKETYGVTPSEFRRSSGGSGKSTDDDQPPLEDVPPSAAAK